MSDLNPAAPNRAARRVNESRVTEAAMAAMAPTEETIDLKQYWFVIWRNKWRIISFVTAVTLAAVFYATTLVPVYSATARMMVEFPKSSISTIEELYGLGRGNREYFATQLEILKSRKIAERVVDELDLVRSEVFNPAPKPATGVKKLLQEWVPAFAPSATQVDVAQDEELLKASIIGQVMDATSVEVVRGTQLVNISFASTNPAMAAKVANHIGDVYIRSNLEDRVEMTTRATSWLSERQLDLRETLLVAEKRLAEFRETNDLVDLQGVESLAGQELNAITAQLSAARNRLTQAEAVYKVVTERSSRDQKIDTLPEIQNHEMVQGAKAKELSARNKIADLELRYGPKHPKMISARAELSSAQNNLQRQIKELVEGIANEYDSAKQSVATFSAELNRSKERYQQVSRKATRFKELQREVEVNRELYDTFLTRYTETSETGDFDQANATITDPAIKPRYPFKPNKKIIVIIAAVISSLVAVGLAFLHEFLHDGVRSVADVENKLSLRMVGLIPAVNVKKGERLPTHSFFDKTDRAFPESVRSLRTAITLSHIDSPAKIITVTSTMPSEGKTTVSSNLAFALGQMENVLLIDADLRKPSVGKMFDLPSYHPGLSNLISGTAKVAECIVKDETSGIDVLPAGLIPPNPQELLGSAKFAKALELLAAKYDRVIIDTAPCQAVSDALILSQYSDTVVYVVKGDATSIKAVRQGVGRLIQVKAHIEGVVLNNVDLSNSNGYYGGYYYYYGYGHESQAGAETPTKEMPGATPA